VSIALSQVVVACWERRISHFASAGVLRAADVPNSRMTQQLVNSLIAVGVLIALSVLLYRPRVQASINY
jgi:hypothetical protein